MKNLIIVILMTAFATNGFASCISTYKKRVAKLKMSNITHGPKTADPEIGPTVLWAGPLTIATGGAFGVAWGAAHGVDAGIRKVKRYRTQKALDLIAQSQRGHGKRLSKCSKKRGLSVKETARRVNIGNVNRFFCSNEDLYSFSDICGKFVKYYKD